MVFPGTVTASWMLVLALDERPTDSPPDTVRVREVEGDRAAASWRRDAVDVAAGVGFGWQLPVNVNDFCCRRASPGRRHDDVRAAFSLTGTL